MTNRGHFLELSVPTDDVRESLEFYQRLAFTELPVGDIREHHYAVVTDGRIALGLHGAGYEEPALSFVWPGIARHVRALEDAGHEFDLVELGDDEFHEAALCSPDGHTLRFMEAGTYSRNAFSDVPVTAIGRSTEITLRCTDFRAAGAFWQNADFIVDDDPAAEPGDAEPVTLRAPGVALGLRADHRWPDPAVRFWQPDIDATLEELDRRGIAHRRGGGGGDRIVTAPEGTRLVLTEDRI